MEWKILPCFCELSELIVKTVGFESIVEFDSSKPDGTMRKFINVNKFHSLGWAHKVEIDEGILKLFDWYNILMPKR